MDTELIYFHAEWCGNCDEQRAVIEEINGVDIVSHDVETDRGTAKANEYSIRSLPAVVIRRDGRVIQVYNGFTPKHEIENAL